MARDSIQRLAHRAMRRRDVFATLGASAVALGPLQGMAEARGMPRITFVPHRAASPPPPRGRAFQDAL
jgi:hypothetical protein